METAKLVEQDCEELQRHMEHDKRRPPTGGSRMREISNHDGFKKTVREVKPKKTTKACPKCSENLTKYNILNNATE